MGDRMSQPIQAQGYQQAPQRQMYSPQQAMMGGSGPQNAAPQSDPQSQQKAALMMALMGGRVPGGEQVMSGEDMLRAIMGG